MIKAVIMDIDGTLLDSMPIWEDLGKRYLASLGIQANAHLNTILFPMSFDEATHYLKEHYHLKQTEKEIKAGLINELEAFYLHQVQLKSGTRDFLKLISQYHIPIIIATTGHLQLIKKALERLHVWHYFQKAYACASKRTADIYLNIAHDLHLNNQDILVVEDTYIAIRSAKNATFLVAHIYDEASWKDNNAIKAIVDFDATNFYELINQLKEGNIL